MKGEMVESIPQSVGLNYGALPQHASVSFEDILLEVFGDITSGEQNQENPLMPSPEEGSLTPALQVAIPSVPVLPVEVAGRQITEDASESPGAQDPGTGGMSLEGLTRQGYGLSYTREPVPSVPYAAHSQGVSFQGKTQMIEFGLRRAEDAEPQDMSFRGLQASSDGGRQQAESVTENVGLQDVSFRDIQADKGKKEHGQVVEHSTELHRAPVEQSRMVHEQANMVGKRVGSKGHALPDLQPEEPSESFREAEVPQAGNRMNPSGSGEFSEFSKDDSGSKVKMFGDVGEGREGGRKHRGDGEGKGADFLPVEGHAGGVKFEDDKTQPVERVERPQIQNPQEQRHVNIRLEEGSVKFMLSGDRLRLFMNLNEEVYRQPTALDVQRLVQSLQNLGLNLEVLRLNGNSLYSSDHRQGSRKDGREKMNQFFVSEPSEDTRKSFSLYL